MINEVNKLIYNALAKHHAVYLPDVGTISVVRQMATMNSKKEVVAPKYNVEYSSLDTAKSLVDIISEEVDVDAKRAEEIYSRWLDKSREGSVLIIDRVGTLRDKSFAADRGLLKVLNTYNQPLRVTRRRSNAPLIALITIIILGAIGVGGWWYINIQPVVEPVKIVAEEIVTTVVELPSVIESEQVEIEVVEDVVEEVVIEEEIVEDWRTRGDIRHWVVVGSYSTTDNAERAISDIVKRKPEVQCDYFKLGSMYAVAIFGSSEISECQQFKNASSKEFAQSWIYTPKKFR